MYEGLRSLVAHFFPLQRSIKCVSHDRTPRAIKYDNKKQRR